MSRPFPPTRRSDPPIRQKHMPMTNQTTTATPSSKSTRNRRGQERPLQTGWILATLAVTQLMVVLDGTIVNDALPSAQADLGFTDALRQWAVTS